MDVCSIIPVNHSNWMYECPRVMLLTHLVEKYPEYVQEALDHPETYKILDNSLIELGGALSMERLVAAADKIKADEIILPDVFKDGYATIASTAQAISWLKEHGRLGDFKLMAVCHGTTETEFIACFRALQNIPEIDVIGIPKVMSSFDWVAKRSRASLYHIFKDCPKEIHFLGSWYQLGELLTLPKEVYNKVRSCDTCLFALNVIQQIDFFEDRNGTIDLEKDYPELTYESYRALMDKFEDAIVQSQLGVKLC